MSASGPSGPLVIVLNVRNEIECIIDLDGAVQHCKDTKVASVRRENLAFLLAACGVSD